MVRVDEAAVTTAVKERVMVTKGTIKAWKRDLVGRGTVAAVSPRPARYVYAIGGTASKQVERFHLQTRRWETCTPLSAVSGYYPAALVLKDHLYAMGGGRGPTAMERFSETANAWEACAAIPRAKYPAAATAVGCKAYVLCGQQLDCFDPDTGTWETLPDAPSPHNCGALATYDQFLFALGNWAPASAIVDRYDTLRRVWERRAPMPMPRAFCGATLLHEQIYVVGSTDDSGSTAQATVLRYDPTTDVWDGTGCAPLPTPRCGLAVCTVNDERILAIGGWTGGCNDLATMEEYDPGTNSWSTCPSMSTGRNQLAGACM